MFHPKLPIKAACSKISAALLLTPWLILSPQLWSPAEDIGKSPRLPQQPYLKRLEPWRAETLCLPRREVPPSPSSFLVFVTFPDSGHDFTAGPSVFLAVYCSCAISWRMSLDTTFDWDSQVQTSDTDCGIQGLCSPAVYLHRHVSV